jgi:hypothetical protein
MHGSQELSLLAASINDPSLLLATSLAGNMGNHNVAVDWQGSGRRNFGRSHKPFVSTILS